jgi:hypothetical protein
MKDKKWIFVSLIIAVFVASFTFVPQAQASAPHDSCWGQATKVFAKMGDMGSHSSDQANPRLGLHNLAVELFNAGVIPDDSMAALGVFVANSLGLSIDACGT